MKSLFLCLLTGFCFTSSLIAQDDGGGEENRQIKGRVAWLVYTSMPEGLENPVSVMTGKDTVAEITLSKRSPSEPIKIPADGIIRIVRKVEAPAPGDQEYITLAQTQIPDGVSKALIILIPTAKNPAGLLFQTKVQDLAAFKGGDSLYLNLTKLRVGVELGKTNLEIKPGEVRIYDAPAQAEPINMPIRYSFFHAGKQEWKLLSASTIVVYSTRREICIFSWDSRYNRIDYHGITFPVTP